MMTNPKDISLTTFERPPSEKPRRSPDSETDSKPRWFIRKGHDEQGPYAREMLARSLRYGSIKPTTLVRAEGETEWHPLSTFPHLITPADMGPSEGESRRSGRGPNEEAIEYVEPGSFGLGFVAGFFGGIVGFTLVRWKARGEKTKTGAAVGFFIGAVLGLIRLLA